MGLFGWVKKTTERVFDPQREERLVAYAAEIGRQISSQKKAFDWDRCILEMNVLPEDLEGVKKRAYELYLERAWRDQQITEEERKGLDLVKALLKLTPDRAKQIEVDFASRVFETVLSTATRDLQLTEGKMSVLASIAAGVGMTRRQMLTGYFRAEGEAIVKRLFEEWLRGKSFDEVSWARLLKKVSALGLESDDLLSIVRPQAEGIVERVLIEAKADEYLSADEDATLTTLLTRFHLSDGFRRYVETEIERLRLYGRLRAGDLPSLAGGGIGMKAGEILHFSGPAVYCIVRTLASGPRLDQYEGHAMITDWRFLFASDSKTYDINHRKVVEARPIQGGVELQTSGKGSGTYQFGKNAKIAILIYRSAVAKANQTLVAKSNELSTRHIARDIRQRIWQKYGGRCAECGSTQYLEFDHVVPVARGGSNSESNVQLLCRACNLKKSDMI